MHLGKIAVVSMSSLAPLATVASAGEVVFNNLGEARPITPNGWAVNIDSGLETDSFVELPGGDESDSRAGDKVTLGGLARLIDRFDVRLWDDRFGPGGAKGAVDMTLDIYDVVGGLPGSLLWSGIRTIDALPESGQWLDVSYAPNVTVPDTIAWAVSFHNLRGRETTDFFGLALTGGIPSVGSSPDSILEQDSATGLWREEFIPPVGNLDGMARITAVPAPSTLVLGALAIATALRRRR